MVELYASLKDIEKMASRLLRCHRAFVINMKNVNDVDNKVKKILFPNNKECLISRRLLVTTIKKIKETNN